MTVATLPPRTVAAPHNTQRVVRCYTVFDKFFPTCGLLDYTEGMYHGDPAVSYEAAQLNQIRYVLDEVQCTAGTRILEVGCGNGNLLDEVRRRGAQGVGITISPEQVALCRQRGLDVRLLNYRDLDDTYMHNFDAVVANGPIEHFVQPREAAAGLTDDIYRRMFETFHAMIDPDSPNRRFINTTIHFVRAPKPADLLISPWRQRRGSDAWHWAWLARSFGGWYPTFGQLERCAEDHFELVHTIDGTQDYHWTSEEWLRRIRGALRKPLGVKMCFLALPVCFRHPLQTLTMLACMLGTESWNWQFRGNDPPTRLLRQTWICK